MELNPSGEAIVCSITSEFTNMLLNRKVHYRVHKNPPLVPILSQINPVHTTPSYLSKIHFSIIYPPTSWSSQWYVFWWSIQWLRLTLSWGPSRVSVSHPLTCGRKQIQFLNVVFFSIRGIRGDGWSLEIRQSRVSYINVKIIYNRIDH
jgi:hypothetical protein